MFANKFFGKLFSVGYSEKDIQDIQDIRKAPNTKSYVTFLLHTIPIYWN